MTHAGLDPLFLYGRGPLAEQEREELLAHAGSAEEMAVHLRDRLQRRLGSRYGLQSDPVLDWVSRESGGVAPTGSIFWLRWNELLRHARRFGTPFPQIVGHTPIAADRPIRVGELSNVDLAGIDTGHMAALVKGWGRVGVAAGHRTEAGPPVAATRRAGRRGHGGTPRTRPVILPAVELRARKVTLALADTFAIARSARDEVEVVQLELEHDGIVGFGEASPVDYWGETADSALGFLTSEAAGLVGGDPFALDAVGRRLAARPGEQAAKSAVDAALHDWIGKQFGQPAWRLLGLERLGPPTSFTIGLDSVEGTRARAARARDFHILKVKVGGPDDLARLEAVREQSDARIRVDGNEGWTLETARELMPALSGFGVEFVEQPFPADDTDSFLGLRELPGRLPVIVDEGCKDLASVAEIAGYADGINVKLAKAGGLREAVRMIHAARALGLRVMLGCMIESELGIAPAAQIAWLADDVDLDGHLLISDSPFRGLGFEDGRVVPSDRPGLGVEPRA